LSAKDFSRCHPSIPQIQTELLHSAFCLPFVCGLPLGCVVVCGCMVVCGCGHVLANYAALMPSNAKLYNNDIKLPQRTTIVLTACECDKHQLDTYILHIYIYYIFDTPITLPLFLYLSFSCICKCVVNCKVLF